MVEVLKENADVDAVEVNERLKAAIGTMINDYFEDRGDMTALREAIPRVIGVDATAKGDLKTQDQSLFQMSAKLSKALGKKVTLVGETNAKGQKNASFKSAEKLEEVWERVRDQFGLSDEQDFSVDLPKLLEFVEQQADTRTRAGDLFNVQEAIDDTAVEVFEAVRDMLSKKTGVEYSLDDALLNEKRVSEAVYDVLDHADAGGDNLIKIGRTPSSIVSVSGVTGDIYIIRGHAYENIVNSKTAENEGRKRKDAHYHNIGAEKYKKAILSIKQPILTYSGVSKKGNPTITMLLSENGDNGLPLYAGIELYSKEPINGVQTVRPHLIVTIASREATGGNRIGYKETLDKAVSEGKVLQFDKEKWDRLPVTLRVVNTDSIAARSLMENITRFKKEVNAFKEKNRINYSLDTDSIRAKREYEQKTDAPYASPILLYKYGKMGVFLRYRKIYKKQKTKVEVRCL